MSAVLLQLKNLGKKLGGRDVLRGINAELMGGDIVGLLGRNGAGKSTLLETLLGLSPPSSGKSLVLGDDCMALSAATKQRIGFVPQEIELVSMLTCERQLKLTASFYSDWDSALVARLMRDWQLPMDRRIHALSVGERQKLATIMALGNRPQLLVLDEPAASLDPAARRGFLRQILEVASEENRGVIFSTHIVSDLERAANRIWFLKDGQLLWNGETEALKQSVMRLHVRASRTLPADLGIGGVVARREGNDACSAVLSVRDFDPGKLPAIEARLDASIEVEPLDLEEIFLELHA